MKISDFEHAAGIMRCIKQLEKLNERFDDASVDPVNNASIQLYLGGERQQILEKDYEAIYDLISNYYEKQLSDITQVFEKL